MGKKTTCLIVVMLVAVMGLFVVGNVDESHSYNSNNLTRLTVYSEGPFNLSEITKDVENSSYFEGYDNNTLNWMKSLGDQYYVFSGNGTYVVMNSHNAEKIPSVFATDVIIVEHFECNVLETHMLVNNARFQKNVLLVDNVNYLGEEIFDIPGGGS